MRVVSLRSIVGALVLVLAAAGPLAADPPTLEGTWLFDARASKSVTEALKGDANALTDEVRRRLAKLEQLAPGDFAAVKRQTDILAAEFTVEEFLEQLEAEHRIKPEVREQRSMGFVH